MFDFLKKLFGIFKKNKPESKKEELRKEMLAFAKDHAVDLYNLLIKVEKRYEDIKVKREKMLEVLAKFNRDPNKDEFIKNCDDLLPQLQKSAKRIKKSINEAYIKYEKCKLNIGGMDYEAELKRITSEITQANADIDEHYNRLEKLNSESPNVI